MLQFGSVTRMSHHPAPYDPEVPPAHGYRTISPFRERAALHTPRRRGPWFHLGLFAATFYSTALASALQQGVNVFADPFAIGTGLPFAIAVMAILLCHECGHYVMARFHGVDATLPYFIPAPPIVLTGTFGAFIRMRTLPPDRRALFDIGAAGPWAGFVIAIPAVIIGLFLSEVRPLLGDEGGLILGDSLLFSFLTRLVLGVSSEEVTILLHPVALAGWFGLLVTSLNLLPVGQLDGGHVAYAVFGRHHRWISRGILVWLVVMGFGQGLQWFIWAGLLMMLGVDHPPPLDASTPLDRRRVILAAMTLVVLMLTFMPSPISRAEFTPPPVFEGELTPVSNPASRHGFVIPL